MSNDGQEVKKRVAALKSVFEANEQRRVLPVPVAGNRSPTRATTKNKGEGFSSSEKKSLDRWLGTARLGPQKVKAHQSGAVLEGRKRKTGEGGGKSSDDDNAEVKSPPSEVVYLVGSSEESEETSEKTNKRKSEPPKKKLKE